MDKKTGYFAYKVRGKGGDNADITEMEHNIGNGKMLCKQLRLMLPDFDIYCPHEHEDLFTIPHRKGDVNSQQILRQCFAIEQLCQYVFICSNPSQSEGVGLEMAHAYDKGLTIVGLYQKPPLDWPEYLAKVVK
jgi:hypothetical protein